LCERLAGRGHVAFGCLELAAHALVDLDHAAALVPALVHLLLRAHDLGALLTQLAIQTSDFSRRCVTCLDDAGVLCGHLVVLRDRTLMLCAKRRLAPLELVVLLLGVDPFRCLLRFEAIEFGHHTIEHGLCTRRKLFRVAQQLRPLACRDRD
jgi:hypothetical protein